MLLQNSRHTLQEPGNYAVLIQFQDVWKTVIKLVADKADVTNVTLVESITDQYKFLKHSTLLSGDPWNQYSLKCRCYLHSYYTKPRHTTMLVPLFYVLCPACTNKIRK
jgi:hypothetical protein